VTRPGWDETFLAIAQIWAERSTCSRRQVGAVVVQDRKVIGNGFNGVAAGKRHCVEGGCPRGQLDYATVPAGADYNTFPCYAIHAEHNAILQAGLRSCVGATLYVTDQPCQQCTNLIEHAGIERVVIYREPEPKPAPWTEWQTPEDKRINLLEGFEFVIHEQGEDQDTTEEAVEHDAPHPSSIEEEE